MVNIIEIQLPALLALVVPPYVMDVRRILQLAR